MMRNLLKVQILMFSFSLYHLLLIYHCYSI
nr:MAG TPA: hypothetical protein [Caudoviricetes sp.]